MREKKKNEKARKRKKDLLTLFDLTGDDIKELVESTLSFYIGEKKASKILDSRVGLLFFEKPSTRTRLSFESAILRMGGGAIYSSPSETQISRGEEIYDFVKVVEGYVDFIVGRVYNHRTLEEFSRNCDIPVINALSDLSHPTQIISDLATIKLFFGSFEGKKVVFVGDAKNNIARTWIEAHSVLGNFELAFLCPEELSPDVGGEYTVGDSKEVLQGADVIYTDVWFSMGEEFSEKKRRELEPYSVDEDILRATGKDGVIVMHCLPAHKGEEISHEVFRRFEKVIFSQAHMKLACALSVLHFIFS